MCATTIRNEIPSNNVNISIRTIRNRLKSFDLESYKPARKPRLTPVMRRRRVEFARNHLNWTEADWAQVMWSDECSVEQFGVRASRVRRLSGQRYNPLSLIHI